MLILHLFFDDLLPRAVPTCDPYVWMFGENVEGNGEDVRNVERIWRSQVQWWLKPAVYAQFGLRIFHEFPLFPPLCPLY